eukprot:5956458-Prymnesium_polylepis.1
METKDGVFTTLQSILENVIFTKPYMEYYMESYMEPKTIEQETKQFHHDPDGYVLRALLPCVKIGKAFVS